MEHMNRKELRRLLKSLGFDERVDRMSWNLLIRTRLEISEELFLHSDAKTALLHIFARQRRELETFIADLEKKVIDY